MGVDWYVCKSCDEPFNDHGAFARCEKDHFIGPCCFPGGEDEWPKDQINTAYEVLEKFCPVCQAGGSTEQRLKKALAENKRLRQALEFYAYTIGEGANDGGQKARQALEYEETTNGR